MGVVGTSRGASSCVAAQVRVTNACRAETARHTCAARAHSQMLADAQLALGVGDSTSPLTLAHDLAVEHYTSVNFRRLL